MTAAAVTVVVVVASAAVLLSLGWAWRTKRRLAEVERAAGAASASAQEAEIAGHRFCRSLELVGQGVVVCDVGGQVVFRNERATDLIGGGMADALAREAVTRLLHGAARGTPGTEPLELLGPPRRALVITAAPLADASRVIGAAAVIEDVSERRRLEAVRRDFVANLSHELKTPIGALALLAETLAAEDDPTVTARLVGRMQVEALRMGRIIEDLLDLSRIESEESPRREALAVAAVMAEAVERVRPLAELRGITILAEQCPVELAVMGDRRQLVAAVHSLVENAVTYSDDGGEVRLAARPSDTWLEIAVADDGVGIPARDLTRIFERFYRVDRGRGRDTGGTGLGLAIARHVAGNHGGEVTVRSQEGRGSTFTLKLPGAAAAIAVSGEAG